MADDSGKKAYEITRILAHKRLQDGTLAYRVHWKGYRAKYNSWVPEPDMSDCFELLNEYKQQNKSLQDEQIAVSVLETLQSLPPKKSKRQKIH